MADADETRLRGPGLTGAGAQPAWDWESLIWGRSFALPLNAQGTPGSAWTLWGAGDIQGFEGTPRQGRYDGQVRSLYLGVDAQWQAHWLAGAALAQSWGETDYVAEPGGRAGQSGDHVNEHLSLCTGHPGLRTGSLGHRRLWPGRSGADAGGRRGHP